METAELLKFTSKFRLNGPNEPPPRKVAKRPRLVCTQCKRSKLRCDRGQPCGSCVKKGDGAGCTYQQQSSTFNESHGNTLAEGKLQHLESLVTELIKTQHLVKIGNSTISSASHNSAAAPQGCGDSRDVSDGGPATTDTFVGSTHWSSILDDIKDLKIALVASPKMLKDNQSQSPDLSNSNHELIFGSAGDYSLHQIISLYLPPKVEVDRYLAAYFQGETYIIPFIHTFQFQRQYRDFWADTTTVHPLWLSILFSICHVASLFGRSTGSPYSPERESFNGNSSFHTAAAQCLVLGNYHRPQKLGIEALALYGQCKNLKSLDPSREVGAILGMVVRMSYELGYHRDPDSIGKFTVFEAEMRRRFWASIKQFDLMTCFQLGLPSNINLENSDTRSPSNLLDSDFDENAVTLPAPRPESEPSKLLWFIIKEKQIISFSKVCQDALSFREKSEPEIFDIDAEIREMYGSIPEVLKSKPMSESIADQPFLIMTRIYLDFIQLKSLCILHRKYMLRGSEFSTRTCVEAGMKLVTQFIEMNNEFSPGGQLYNQRWMVTNFTVNDFLLGTMVLALAIHLCQKKSGDSSHTHAERTRNVLELLRQAHSLCVDLSPVSKDALRVSHIIRLTLNRATTSSSNPFQQDVSTPISKSNIVVAQRSDPEGSSFSVLPSWQSCMPGGDTEFGIFDDFDFINNDFENIDWMALDPYFVP